MHFHDVLETQKDTIKQDTFEARCFPVTTPLFFGLSQHMKRPPPWWQVGWVGWWWLAGLLAGWLAGWLGYG